MRILLHICCAPCTLYSLDTLRSEGHEVVGFFRNPNIHPYQEYAKRLESVRVMESGLAVKMIYHEEYEVQEFLRQVVFREQGRCRICYFMRLKATAGVARHGRFDAFTTTLLASRQQDHRLIKEIGVSVGEEEKIPFYYSDFRSGWKEGIELSKSLKLYRQQYCGCIYSEQDRFCKADKSNSLKASEGRRGQEIL